MKINAVVPTTQRRSGTTIRDGVRDLEQTLARTFGIIVDGFVRIDVKAFVELVDYLGGVDLEVPRGPHGDGLHWEDPSQNLIIHLKPGKQHLDGYRAMGFVRWRKDQCKEEHGDGEPGRNARQRAFLQEVASKVAGKLSQRNWEAASTAANLAAIAHSHVTTDLDVRQIMAVAQIAREVNSAGIEGATAPVKGERNGPPLGFVYFSDPMGTQRLIRETWVKLSGEKALAAIAKTELLNGCGRAGIADRAKQQLTAIRAHVVRTGNALDNAGRPAFTHPKTVVRCTPKFARAGKQIAAALGLPDAEIREDLATDPEVDVSVILGSDYRPSAR
jgi:LCP family protein required for cell wall assembly